MEFFGPIFTFVTDKSNKALQKALLVAGTIIILVFLDNLFGFSYYYNLSNKVTIASQIHNILKDNIVDTQTKQHLISINKEMFERVTFTEFLYSTYLNIFKSTSNYYVFFTWLTGSSMLIFFMIAGLYAGYQALKNPLSYIINTPLKTLQKVFLVEMALSLLSVIFTLGFLLIPIIYNHEYLNYILNILLNLFFLYLVSLLPFFRKKKVPANSTATRANT